MKFREYPGYFGAHTRDQAPGAIASGRKVRKIATERGDPHPVGATATVLGSVFGYRLGYGYFVAWDDEPTIAVLVVAAKLAEA